MCNDRTCGLNVHIVADPKPPTTTENDDVAINSDIASKLNICQADNRCVLRHEHIRSHSLDSKITKVMLIEIAGLQALNHTYSPLSELIRGYLNTSDSMHRVHHEQRVTRPHLRLRM